MMNSERHQSWTLEDIPYGNIGCDCAVHCPELFYLVVTASFIEITTDLYTDNLIQYFDGDDELNLWLREHWLPEELQHGRALRHYVQTAWPDFDWEGAYENFRREYATCCRVDALEPTRCGELASRCVVEMGTASYYTALGRISADPVFSKLAWHIREDEIRHYKYFYYHFRKYRKLEGVGRAAVLRSLWHRLKLIDGEDGLIAYKYAFSHRNPDSRFAERDYRDFLERCGTIVHKHFPYGMSVKMLIRPLGLGPRMQRLAIPALTALSRRLVG